MESLYRKDLAYIQAAAFGNFARNAAPEIVRLLRAAAVPIRRVVDAGCGAGVLTQALITAGFDVTGMDASAELTAIARSAVPQARFINASVYEAELPACDAVIALGEPLTYHGEDADADALVGKFFQRVSSALPVGGVCFFDVIELGEPSLNGRTWSSGADWAVLVETAENQPTRTLIRNIETFRRVGEGYRRGGEVHRVRLFDAGALLDQLAFAGFATETAQAYGAQPLPPRRRAFFATRVRADCVVL